MDNLKYSWGRSLLSEWVHCFITTHFVKQPPLHRVSLKQIYSTWGEGCYLLIQPYEGGMGSGTSSLVHHRWIKERSFLTFPIGVLVLRKIIHEYMWGEKPSWCQGDSSLSICVTSEWLHCYCWKYHQFKLTFVPRSICFLSQHQLRKLISLESLDAYNCRLVKKKLKKYILVWQFGKINLKK